ALSAWRAHRPVRSSAAWAPLLAEPPVGGVLDEGAVAQLGEAVVLDLVVALAELGLSRGKLLRLRVGQRLPDPGVEAVGGGVGGIVGCLRPFGQGVEGIGPVPVLASDAFNDGVDGALNDVLVSCDPGLASGYAGVSSGDAFLAQIHDYLKPLGVRLGRL